MKSSETLPLTAQEWRSLYVATVSAAAGARHDLLSAVRPVIHLSGMLVDDLRQSHDARVLDETKLLHAAELTLNYAARAERIVRASIPAYPDSQKEDPFIAPVEEIIQTLLDLFPDATIQVERSISAPVCLLYPRVSLFAVIHELVSNSVKHSAKPSEVRITWALKGRRFTLCIDDNGPGFSERLSSAYMDFHSIQRELRSRGAGLSAISNIVFMARGLLLFRRSESMGGTQALVEFPVIGAWIGEQYQHFGL